MEDNLNILENGRRPQFIFENGSQPQFFWKWKTTIEAKKDSNENSPIPQLDGICESESQKNGTREVFSFKSDFAEKNIENCIDEIFKNTNVSSAKIILRDQLRPSSADYLYNLKLIIDNGIMQMQDLTT